MLTLIKKDDTFEFYNENEVGVGSVMTQQLAGKLQVDSVYTVHEFRGQGLAAQMMDAVASYATEQNLELIPVCSYAQAYMKKRGMSQ